MTPELIRFVGCAPIKEAHAHPHALSGTRPSARCPFQYTKEPFRGVFCALLGPKTGKKGGKAWPKTLHERIQGRWCHSAPGDRRASDGGSRSIFSMR